MGHDLTQPQEGHSIDGAVSPEHVGVDRHENRLYGRRRRQRGEMAGDLGGERGGGGEDPP
jgi:hypothetical protein